MGLGLSTTLRTARAQAIIDACGANAKIKFFSGVQPSTGGTETTLLGTVIGGTTIGTASSGVIAFNEAGFTQTNASHSATGVAPTWARFTKSDNTFVADINIGSGGMGFVGTIVTGVDINLTANGEWTITEGNT